MTRARRLALAAAVGAALAACSGGREPGAGAAPDAAAAGHPRYQHVLMISVDGLRPEAAAGPGGAALPGFARLLAGAATLDARTDPDWTITLPNHTGMLTGRCTEGEAGHHWRLNDLPPPGQRLRGEVGGVFDAAAAAGLRCALFASKPKFVLYPRSWNGVDAARAAGPIHEYDILGDAAGTLAAVRAFWEQPAAAAGSLAFAHLRDTDTAGHDHGWDLDPASPYSAAVARVDAALTATFDWLDARPEFRARTAIILTTDHGGGTPFKNHHGEGRAATNYVIPFLVWTGDGRARGDLYDANPRTRARPGALDPRRDDPGPPPIRNADAANLALALLGLAPIPGSTVNALQDLRVEPARAP